MNPGCTEFTRTPRPAQCSAMFLGRVRTAPLVAWYAGEVPNPPLVPKIELMLITGPVPGRGERRSGRLHPQEHAGLIDPDRAAPVRQRRVLDRREVAHARIVHQDVQPAELTGPPPRPQPPIQPPTSHEMDVDRAPPFGLISPAIWAPASSWISVTRTAAPSLASRLAVAARCH